MMDSSLVKSDLKIFSEPALLEFAAVNFGKLGPSLYKYEAEC